MNTFINIQGIYWREPLWLLLIFQPIIIVLIKKIIYKNTLSLYADKKLQPWVVISRYHELKKIVLNKNTTYLTAWLCFSLAIAGPRVALNHSDNQQVVGTNIMLLVDLSRSMKAMDIIPNRLSRAKIEIHEFLMKAHAHRIGITVFSARPHLFVPLTYDHAALQFYLESLESLKFPTSGSDTVSAILFAQKELQKTKGASSIILLTDGDFPQPSKSQIKNLQLSNIPLYVLGIGSIEGEAIQVKDGTWLKFNNQDVISRMNEDNLTMLAKKLNGKYSSVYDDDSDWNTLYDNGVASDAALETSLTQNIVWRELFHYFLIPSVILFFFSLSTHRFKYNNHFLVVLFIILMPLTDKNAIAFELNFGKTIEQKAFREFRDKNFVAAEKTYKNIPGYVGYFGHANSLYKMGHYNKAIRRYVSATLSAETTVQRANALYNLGNSYFRTGNFSLAIATFKDVLRYQPNNKSSEYNIEISRLLKENIEQRIKEREKIITSSRQGRGASSANIANGTDISENTSVSMGGSKKTLNKNIPIPELPNLNEDQVRKLILSGLSNIHLAENGIMEDSQGTKDDTVSNIEMLNTQQQIEVMSESQHFLWKRLFEIEEGFPAPVETPKTLPGVKTW